MQAPCGTLCVCDGATAGGGGGANKDGGGRKCNVAFVLSFTSHTREVGVPEVSKVGEVGGVWNNVNIKMFHKIIPIKM